jgi:pSer/pThr/pTyr-binding forkhead associated (FHA) protein
MPKLIISSGGKESSVALSEGSNIIGRSSKNAVPINDGAASREHAEVVVRNGEAIVLDKGSRNGTLLNGQRLLAETKLAPGDVIRIGETYLHFEVRRAPETRRQEAPPAAADSRMATAARGRVIVKDYAVWTPTGMEKLHRLGRLGGSLVLILLGLSCLAGIGYVVSSQFKSARTISPNLIKAHPGFEAGDPSETWELSGAQSRLTLDRSSPMSGAACLAVDKGDVEPVLHCWHKTPFKLESGKQVDVSAAIKFDGFKGYAAFHVVWLDRAETPVLEDYGSVVSEAAGWKRMQGRFVPPKGASSFRFGVTALGGVGKISIDDILLENRFPFDPVSPYRLGEYSIAFSGQAVQSSATWRTLPVMVGVQLILRKSKEEAIPAIFVEPPKIEARGEKSLTVSGKVIGPVGGGLLDLTREMTYENGTLSVDETFVCPMGQAFEELEIVSDFPAAKSLPGGGETQVVNIRMGSHEFAIEYPERARLEKLPGRNRLKQSFRVERERAVVAWRVREMSTTLDFTIQKLNNDVKNLRRHEKWGAVRDGYRELNRILRDPEEIARNQKEIEAITEKEARHWEKVRREATVAILSGREELAKSAAQSIHEFLNQFDNPSDAAEVERLRTEVLAVASGRKDSTGRLRRMLDLARHLKTAGKSSLARGVCEAVIGFSESGELQREARELLESLPK